MKALPVCTAWLFVPLASFTLPEAKAKIASPCSACNAIAQELQTRLNNEPVSEYA